ncbi:hypothetical protein ACJX0J_008572 [Zea mays]
MEHIKRRITKIIESKNIKWGVQGVAHIETYTYRKCRSLGWELIILFLCCCACCRAIITRQFRILMVFSNIQFQFTLNENQLERTNMYTFRRASIMLNLGDPLPIIT